MLVKEKQLIKKNDFADVRFGGKEMLVKEEQLFKKNKPIDFNLIKLDKYILVKE